MIIIISQYLHFTYLQLIRSILKGVFHDVFQSVWLKSTRSKNNLSAHKSIPDSLFWYTVATLFDYFYSLDSQH